MSALDFTLDGSWHLLDRVPARNADGYNVEIDVYFAPARFYRVRVLATPNSLGEPRPGFTLATGSSCAPLARTIAEAFADGSLGLDYHSIGGAR